MNTLKDTLSTLLPDARLLAEVIMEAAGSMFVDNGFVAPGVFAIPVEGGDVKIQDVEINEDNKMKVWTAIREVRKSFPIVGFASQCKMLECKVKKLDRETLNDLKKSPDAKTMANFVLWQIERTIIFGARLHSKPRRVEEWRVIYDSDFPDKDMGKPIGTIVEGESYSSGRN